MEDFLTRAKTLATQLHANQKRWGGEPYISHPEAVAQAVSGHGPNYAAVAWLHDVLEDTLCTAGDLLTAGFPDEVVASVVLLTRIEGESYCDCIVAILESGNDLALKVKIADLKHNLSTSNSKHNSLREKWKLALYILENCSRQTSLPVAV